MLLKREIQRWDLVFLLINAVIGAGIFGLPSKVFALAGPWSLLAFFICALLLLGLVTVFAEVSARFDQTGGPYVYLREAFGPLPAYVVGWLMLITRLFSYATLINILLLYLSFFSDAFLNPIVKAGSIVVLSLSIVLINVVGIRQSLRFSHAITYGKLIPLLLFIGLGVFFLEPAAFDFSVVPSQDAFTSALLILVFAFSGFEAVLVNSGEIAQPRRDLPLSLAIASAGIAVIYVLIQVVSIGTLPELATSERPLADAATAMMGWGGGLVITLGAMVSIIGTLHVQVLSGSRLPYALSLNQQLPGWLGRVHPTYQTPYVSIIAFGIGVMLISILWGYMSTLAVTVIARLLMYLMVCAALLKLRRSASSEGHRTLPLGIFWALVCIVFISWMLFRSPLNELLYTAAWLAAGLLLYVGVRWGKGW